MFKMKAALFLVFMLFALIVQPAFAERPLEDASYSEGMKAIKEMHVLNSLGLAGELIGIYKALNQASYAAAILHNRKWRPGEDDLSWVDDPDYGKIRQDPFAGLLPSDKHTVKLILSNIQYENRLLESGNLNSADKKEALLIIQGLVKDLKRKLASYPDFYAKAFPTNRAIVCSNGGLLSGIGGDGKRYSAEWSGNGRLEKIPYRCCNNTPFLHFKLNDKPWPNEAWGVSESTWKVQCK